MVPTEGRGRERALECLKNNEEVACGALALANVQVILVSLTSQLTT